MHDSRFLLSRFLVPALVAAAPLLGCGEDPVAAPTDWGAGQAGAAAGGGGEATNGTGGGAQVEDLFGVLVPAKMEAEAFVRANELDAAQDGQEECVSSVDPGVDIEAAENASGGCVVGYTAAGEWLEYDIAVAEGRTFDVVLSMATALDARTVSIFIDGVERGQLTAPADDWYAFGDVTLPGVSLGAGNHVLRIVFNEGSTNLDTIEFIDAGECVSSCAGLSCGVDFCGNECGVCAEGQSCVAGACNAPTTGPVGVHGQLAVTGGKVVGENGQPAQLRGVSTQWLNYDAIYAGNKRSMEFMRDEWGMEVYRIANGVEGNGGYLQESATRLAQVKAIINFAIELGVYVIVDWHTHEVHQSEAVAFFQDIATTYGDQPNIIYEPFNEPIGQSWSSVKAYHQVVVNAIRAIDPNNLIILGSPNWSQDVDVAAASPVSGTNLAYTLHFYSCTHSGSLRSRAQNALNSGAAIFVTEWGSTHADGGTPSNPGVCLSEAGSWHTWMDQNDIGSAAWKLVADPDDSSILATGASAFGGWTDANLTAHGRYVRSLILKD